MALLISIIFLIITIFFYKLEQTNEYKITPIFALGVPYGVIMLLVSINDIFWNRYGYKMNVWVTVFSCIYLTLFALIGILVSSIFSGSKSRKMRKSGIRVSLKHEKIYFVSMLLFLLFLFIYYVKIFGFKLHEYSKVKSAFASGFYAHIINFTTALMIINFFALLNNKSTKKIKLLYLFPIFWIVFLLFTDTKYTLFMYVFTLIFEYTYIKYDKINLKKVAIASFIASCLFIVAYAVRFLLEGYNFRNIPFDFILNHFTYYLIGSFYGFSKIIELSLKGVAGIGIVFAPIINLYKILSGENLISTVANFVPIDKGNLFDSTNVFTLFGALQYETSVVGTIILLIFISFFIYYNFYKMKKYNKLNFVPLNSYLCSTLVMSFFNCFYGTVNVWEIIISLLIIAYIEEIKIKL